MTSYSVSIIGMGYVGLCTAVGFASKACKVVTYDIDHEKLTLINRGIAPFYEPDLEETLKKTVDEQYLICLPDLEDAILKTDIAFITVGTPSKPDGSIDLSQVEEAVVRIGDALRKKDKHQLIVVKSTVIPGTTENVVKPLLEKHSGKHCGKEFGLCMNPEFLREGSAIHDTLHPDRIVIGENDKKSGDALELFYRSFYGEEAPPIIRTNLSTAELIKYANNAFLATKISFINTVANICEKIPGADVKTVAGAIGLDKRIGPLFLNAGLGYGGYCLPKDLKALISFSKGLGYDPVLLDAVEDVNEAQPNKAVEIARALLGGLKDKRVAILGLAFKPNTDDIREAVSIKIIRRLLEEKAKVVAYDPSATDNARKIFKEEIDFAASAADCLKDTDCCIIVTEWEEFKNLQPEDFIERMRNPLVIDGRRIFNPELFEDKLKFAAIGLGQPRKTDP
ncbi:MAG: UDP-glucose/GDP-mannose dehydrogenase family protein [Thermoproteota archaeon]